MADLMIWDELEELSSAEDFLDYFGLSYQSEVVFINRLHIMQRFGDYLAQNAGQLSPEGDEQSVKAHYRRYLQQAYEDFVHSDAQTEKVFKVFKAQQAFVPLDQLLE